MVNFGFLLLFFRFPGDLGVKGVVGVDARAVRPYKVIGGVHGVVGG